MSSHVGEAIGHSAGTIAELAADLATRVPPGHLLTDPTALRAYDCDGLTSYRVTPALVVLAGDEHEVAVTVEACSRHGVPFVSRGSGTGLSGGATPSADGVLIVLSRLRSIQRIDVDDHRAVVDPGVINLDVTRAASPHGLYYAPDPSSQQVCSIGGNVAENSGGAHCLKYGFTSNHVTGLDVVIASGEKVSLGGYALEYPGYDLVGAFVGSEGTLGVVTSATVRLLRAPEKVRTLLAGFPSTDAAGAAVSSIIARGIVPAAIEMMDELAIEAAERAVACGYPRTAAVLIVELDGSATAVDHDMALVQEIVDAEGAVELRHADDAVDRAAIWRGRKSAFAAVGRISPDYYVQDGVVPRTALPEVLRRIGELAQAAGLRVANVFHAGDGNLHPLVLYDASVPGESERGAELSSDIVELCVSLGGSITGEHGVGLDKVCSMPKMFSETDLEVMQLLRDVFDVDRLCNPGKLYPTPGLCGEKPGPRSGVHPLVAEGLAEMF